MRATFEWLDIHPQFYWGLALCSTIALLAGLALGLRPAAAEQPSRGRGLGFAVLLWCFLFAWRWPYLFGTNEYNPDESQLIAGAITFLHDPVPWRSLDVATSGPLNYYALLPLRLLGLPLDYFTARLTGLLLIGGALLACRRLFRSFSSPGIANLAVLPLAVFFATASDWDLVHYSSEHVPLFLTALAAAWLFSGQPADSTRRMMITGGMIAGLLPWAKLQAGPLMAALVAIKAIHLLMDRSTPAVTRWRNVGLLASAVLVPTVVVMAVLTVWGQWDVFWHSYVLANINYVNDSPNAPSPLAEFIKVCSVRGHVLACSVSALSFLVFGAVTYGLARQGPKRLFALGAIGFACAVACVLTPQRPLLHYLLLAVIPLGWWLGAALVENWTYLRRHPLLLGGFAAAALIPLAWQTAQEDPPELGNLAEDWRHPRSAAGNLIRAYSTPADAMAVWGWWPALYVDANRRQGVHDGNSSWSMPLATPAAQRDYYQARYLRDLESTRPLFFVDAVGPGAPFYVDRSQHGHETVEALKNFIQHHYRLWVDLESVRIFVRRDSSLPAAPPPEQVTAFLNQARRDPGLAASRPLAISPASAPREAVRGRMVQMMHPGTSVTWQLDGTERAVWLDYGFHPHAYREGKTNGAEFLVELVKGTQAPQLLFRRLIDPQRQSRDRRPLSTRLALPPFGPDSRLIVRTTAGENGDAAWDWVYLDRVHFLRSPGYLLDQFPNFNVAPDALTSGSVAIIDGEQGKYLSLHAPSELHFTLGGTERSLQLDYGFDAGAYTQGGQTDGAIFVVERRRPEAATVEFFRRFLHPLDQIPDRGPQHTQVPLSGLQAGDELIVRIESGPGGSWDWTYLSGLNLR